MIKNKIKNWNQILFSIGYSSGPCPHWVQYYIEYGYEHLKTI